MVCENSPKQRRVYDTDGDSTAKGAKRANGRAESANAEQPGTGRNAGSEDQRMP